MYIHSLCYSLICSASWVLVTSVVSYLVARFDFRFSKVIFSFVVITMCIPIVGAMASELRMLQNLIRIRSDGIYDSITASDRDGQRTIG